MNVLLVEQELAARENEPADHIAVQLALMAKMVGKEQSVAEQYYFCIIILCAGHHCSGIAVCIATARALPSGG